MRLLRDLLAWLRGGTARLNHVEARLVACIMEHLSTNDALTIQAQLDLISLVQRPQPGRMTIAFYAKTPPLLENRDNEACLAKVKYHAADGRRRRVLLMVHSGYFQSIEGHVPRTMEDLRDISVSIWPEETSFTSQAMHRLEHGADPRA